MAGGGDKYDGLDDSRLYGLNAGTVQRKVIPDQASIDGKRISNTGLLRRMMLDELKKQSSVSVLDGVTRLKGVVLRHEPPFHSSIENAHPWADMKNAPPEFRSPPITVRIPEVHACLPVPKLIGPMAAENDVESAIIDVHTVFVPASDDVPKPKVGSIVWVGWENMKTMQGPLYFGPVANNNSTVGIEYNPKASDLFDSYLIDAINKTNVQDLDTDIKIGTPPEAAMESQAYVDPDAIESEEEAMG
tara:strand:- start:499 stop:1236 length:738 start_codon:yes stop_codon:yes gene_type:complete